MRNDDTAKARTLADKRRKNIRNRVEILLCLSTLADEAFAR